MCEKHWSGVGGQVTNGVQVKPLSAEGLAVGMESPHNGDDMSRNCNWVFSSYRLASQLRKYLFCVGRAFDGLDYV